jgi:uncharacterized OB-fold protein
MARKSLGFVPLIWECPSCGTQNPGPIKTCTSCGAPQPADVEFLQVDQEKFDFIKDEALIRMAKAGPDIHCPWCGTRNPATAKLCSNCGGELSQGGKPRQTGGKVRTVSEAHTQTSETVETPRRKMRPIGIIIGAIILIAIIVGGIIISKWINETQTVNATVSGVYWERSIGIEEYMQVTRSDWEDQIPASADIQSCTMEHRYTSDQPEANATEVCGEEYVEDTGTGVGEVIQDCVYEVYDNYCDYNDWEWQAIDPVISYGYDLSPYWPTLNLTRNQQEAGRDEEFLITFTDGSKDYDYSTTDLNLFLLATPNSAWKLEVNRADTIKEVNPSN